MRTDNLCSFSTLYRENSIRAMARAAAENGNYGVFCTTLYLARWQVIAQRLPLISSRLAQELGRRAFLDISADRVTGIAMLLELAHVAARRLLG